MGEGGNQAPGWFLKVAFLECFQKMKAAKDSGPRAHRAASASPASPSIPPAKGKKILGFCAASPPALLTLL